MCKNVERMDEKTSGSGIDASAEQDKKSMQHNHAATTTSDTKCGLDRQMCRD